MTGYARQKPGTGMIRIFFDRPSYRSQRNHMRCDILRQTGTVVASASLIRRFLLSELRGPGNVWIHAVPKIEFE